MSELLLWGLVGAFIGWNVPQPFWATWLQNKAVDLFNKAKNHLDNQ